MNKKNDNQPLIAKVASMRIPDLEQINQLPDITASPAPPASFWEAKGFDELAAEQGIYPLSNLTELKGDWPIDADFEEFLTAVRSTRKA